MANGETPNMAMLDCKFYKDNGYTYLFEKVCRAKVVQIPSLPIYMHVCRAHAAVDVQA